MKTYRDALAVALAAVVPLASTPRPALADCCGETYRLECQTVYEERQVTAYRMEQEGKVTKLWLSDYDVNRDFDLEG